MNTNASREHRPDRSQARICAPVVHKTDRHSHGSDWALEPVLELSGGEDEQHFVCATGTTSE